MKLAWNIIAFVAIMNLLAVLFFGGWLAVSGRVNNERIESVRTLFAVPADTEAAAGVRGEARAGDPKNEHVRGLCEHVAAVTCMQGGPRRCARSQAAGGARDDVERALQLWRA